MSAVWESEAPAGAIGSNKIVMGLLASIAVIASLVALVAIWRMPSSDLRVRVKAENGIQLPVSASKIQCRGDASIDFLDRNAFTIFEMDRHEQANFVASLKVNKRELPVRSNPGDPIAVNVRGKIDYFNSEAGNFVKTWQRPLIPLEMLSCQSPVHADFLNVEFWEISAARLLVKIHSNWN